MRNRIRSSLALALIVAIVAGAPVALYALTHQHLPQHIPSWEQIKADVTQPDRGQLLWLVLGVAAVYSWAGFTLSVARELSIARRHRGRPMPDAETARRRAPWALKPFAGAAVGLVGMLLAMQPVAASAATPAAPPAVIATSTVTAATPIGTPTAHSTSTATATSVDVTVRPGDTIVDETRKVTGSSATWRDTVAANLGRLEPGGAHLTDPDLIRPGWTLTVPLPATQTAPAPAAATAAPTTQPAPATVAPAPVAPQPVAPTAPQPTQIATATPAPTTVPTVRPAPALTQATTHADTDTQSSSWVSYGAGIGAVLATGIAALLYTRRAAQHRRRRFGAFIPMPEGDDATFEADLHDAADPVSRELVDRALRSLGDHANTTGTPLPVIRGARLATDEFELYLAEPAVPVSPWIATADHLVWRLGDDTHDLLTAEQATQVIAPYPALVTLGHDDDGAQIMLDLEYITSIAINADGDNAAELRTGTIAALAIELATSIWADDLSITLVGAHPEMESILQTGRITYAPTAAHVINKLTRAAAEHRAALTVGGYTTTADARAHYALDDTTPEILLIAAPITDSERRQIVELADATPRVAVAAVTTSGDPTTEWSMHIDSDGQSAVLEPRGIRIRPQLLTREMYTQFLRVVDLADTDHVDDELLDSHTTLPPLDDLPTPADTETPAADDVAVHADTVNRPANEPVPAATDEATSSSTIDPDEHSANNPTNDETHADDDLVRDAAPLSRALSPRLNILGQVELLNAPGQPDKSNRAKLLELAAWIVTHPTGSMMQMERAVWPSLVQRISELDGNGTDEAEKHRKNLQKNRHSQINRLRRWVGANNDGQDYLQLRADRNGYILPLENDWDDLREALRLGAGQAATTDLEKAVSLVRGRPFGGDRSEYPGASRRGDKFGWSARIFEDGVALIEDAAEELARRRVMEGRYRAAEEAAKIGILGGRGERAALWRIRILAAHMTGDTAAEAEAIDRIIAITDTAGDDIDPETAKLLKELTTGHPVAARATMDGE